MRIDDVRPEVIKFAILIEKELRKMELDKMSEEELLNTLVKLESQRGTVDNLATRRSIRVELFRRGVNNINGVPLEVLLRNPLLKEDYDEAMKGEKNNE